MQIKQSSKSRYFTTLTLVTIISVQARIACRVEFRQKIDKCSVLNNMKLNKRRNSIVMPISNSIAISKNFQAQLLFTERHRSCLVEILQVCRVRARTKHVQNGRYGAITFSKVKIFSQQNFDTIEYFKL